MNQTGCLLPQLSSKLAHQIHQNYTQPPLRALLNPARVFALQKNQYVETLAARLEKHAFFKTHWAYAVSLDEF